MGGDQSWKVSAFVDDPDASDDRRAPVGTGKRAINLILHAILGLRHRSDGVSTRLDDQCVSQNFPLGNCESEAGKEPRLGGSFRMVEREQVVGDLALFDACVR